MATIPRCIPSNEFPQATKEVLALYGQLTREQRRGLAVLHKEGVLVRLPQVPGAGSPRTTTLSPLDWGRFLEACKDYDPIITPAFRNYLLDTLNVTSDRVDGGLGDAIKVMFSSETQFTGFRGQIYSLRALADDPAYASYRFSLEVDDYTTNRRIDIQMLADGKRIDVEVKAYEHWEFDSDTIWTNLLGPTGQFTRDLTGAIERSTSLDDLFDDLLYFFPDPAQYPNVDLDRVKDEFLLPFIQSGPTHELVPQMIKDAAAKKGYDLVALYERLESRVNADMIRSYTTP